MSEHNPWTTLSSREVYQNPWLRLREDEVLRPDGEPGIYGVIETRIATGVVALTPSREVYLVGQYRYPLDLYSWELPEGGSDEGETALDAVQRELREETGLTAAHWEQLGAVVHLSNCFSAEEAFLFLAEDLEQAEAAPDGNEELRVKRVPFEEALRMVHEGEITDAMSIIGLLRAERALADR
jgi:8-oxo-dGTP pyrophosphatase MutT (NUDIX family)